MPKSPFLAQSPSGGRLGDLRRLENSSGGETRSFGPLPILPAPASCHRPGNDALGHGPVWVGSPSLLLATQRRFAGFKERRVLRRSPFLSLFGPPLPEPWSSFPRPDTFTPKARNSTSSPLIFVAFLLSAIQLGVYRALFLLRNQSQARLFFPLASKSKATARDGVLRQSPKKRLCGFALCLVGFV
jgi:hypothetical protein